MKLSLFLICAAFSSFASVKELTLEEKVGQLLMVHFNGEMVNEEAKTLVQTTKVGAIIYYNWANGLLSPAQAQALSHDLQQLTLANPHPIPLLIAADQEGGLVTRLNDGFTKFPGNKALGETGNPALAEEAAFAMGVEMQAVGVNMNLAPVVDVNSNPRNPIIGIRAFGDNPQTVVAFGEQAVSGYHKANIITTLKHFPGHGDVEIDSHEDLPVVRKPKEELERVDLLPFTKLCEKTDAVMTAHILVPALDDQKCSTLSKKTLDYLRETIGFQGVIVADSLVMEGVIKQCGSVDEAAIQALEAGCDLLILGGKLLVGEKSGFELTAKDVQRVHRAILQAVEAGRISEARVDEAVERILQLKNRYLTKKHKAEQTKIQKAIAEKIAAAALKLTQNGNLPSLQEKQIALFAPQLIETHIDQTALKKQSKSMSATFYGGLNPTETEISNASEKAKTADVLLICTYNAWKNPSQKKPDRHASQNGQTHHPMDSQRPARCSSISHSQSCGANI